MQFCQPPFQPTGFPNYGQPLRFNAPIPNPNIGYPDIIGEGNVVSIISPDGSTQLMFFPTLQWPQWRAFPQNPYAGNFNNPYLTQPINTLGAWYVRNICNPIQPTAFPQPFHQDCFSLQCPRTSASDCCLNLAPPVLPLKFHNDTCTSTTDIHYFFPKQFNWFRTPTGCAAVQVACPVQTTATACDYSLNCDKPCNCTPAQPCNCNCAVKEKKVEKQSTKCECFKIKNSSSRMSVDSTRSHSSRHKKKSHSKSKKSCHKCECKEPSGADKCVSTCADQGTYCAPDIGQETQTSCSGVPIITLSKGVCNSMCYRAEKWLPKPCSKQASSQSLSSERCNVSNSGTSCSTSGTDRDNEENM